MIRVVLPAHLRKLAGLEGVEDGPLRDRSLDDERQLAADAPEHPQVVREYDSDHGRVCTSTDSTDGKCEAMADQLSPPSADPYTCPPVVPK